MGIYRQDPVAYERKPNRLKRYDYSKCGMYFITVCIKDHVEFGNVRNGCMMVNEYGDIVQQQWLWLGNQYSHIELDAFVVMPDHVHGIICIVDDSGICSIDDPDRSGHKIKPIPEIIGAFKTTSSKLIHRAGLDSFKWQKSYYDHIIRNELSLQNIRRYIVENPVNVENGNATDRCRK